MLGALANYPPGWPTSMEIDNGQVHTVEAATDPVLCGPCTLVRWRRILNTAVTRHTTRAVADFLKKAKEVAAISHHPCRNPKPIDDKTLAVPLFPPINQWGHLPEPIRALSAHSTSHLARQANTGVAHHKVLDVEQFVAAMTVDHRAPESAPVERSVWDWAAANKNNKQAIAAMATLTQTMDDIDARTNALVERTRNLELD